MEENIRIKKISVEALMEMLEALYRKGVDFVDLYGSPDEEEDSLGISFSREYMNPEYAGDFDSILEAKDEADKGEENEDKKEETPQKDVNIRLSDDDINQIMY